MKCSSADTSIHHWILIFRLKGGYTHKALFLHFWTQKLHFWYICVFWAKTKRSDIRAKLTELAEKVCARRDTAKLAIKI